ncbi:hypothetical protein CLV45_0991 [Hymenobacter chitinivorans DSM 11115]|uniref:Uncharacterized protein n=1 Tax=Hymenobacter chitinivorans DSM 11115 TaxID=1121954 RepID=A0A2M9BNQ8_9BACT|nr:hypothetical protein CLV45_0991 [Hymenobacter chitinivorans DSM 11115]
MIGAPLSGPINRVEQIALPSGATGTTALLSIHFVYSSGQHPSLHGESVYSLGSWLRKVNLVFYSIEL